jgi:pimeloyl-ACP methyl ester carboxylesterase
MSRALKHTCTNGVAAYVLVHGSEHSSWYWRLVVPALEALGDDARAVDLPGNDDNAGLEEYADAVVEAGGERRGIVLVAHSLAGFTVPLACQRLAASLMVLVAAMVPRPGEMAAE